MGAEFFHAEEQTDMTKLMGGFAILQTHHKKAVFIYFLVGHFNKQL
jgi:hypothetical protein